MSFSWGYFLMKYHYLIMCYMVLGILKISITKMSLNFTYLELMSHVPGVNELIVLANWPSTWLTLYVHNKKINQSINIPTLSAVNDWQFLQTTSQACRNGPQGTTCMDKQTPWTLGALYQPRVSLNHSMDKWVYPLDNMGRNYLSIPKLNHPGVWEWIHNYITLYLLCD